MSNGRGNGTYLSNSEKQAKLDAEIAVAEKNSDFWVKDRMRRINTGACEVPNTSRFDETEVMTRYHEIVHSLKERDINSGDLGIIKNIVDYMNMSVQTRDYFSNEIKVLNGLIGSYKR